MSFANSPAQGRASTPFPTLFAFALPGLPLAAMVVVFGVYLPRFYVGLGIDFLAVAGAIATVRFIDMWFDPIIGMVMDRTKTPLGRYRPWLLVGAPVAMLGTWKVLIPGANAGTAYLVTWMLVAYVGVSMLTLSMAAWSAVLAKSYNERSRVYGVTQGLAVIGVSMDEEGWKVVRPFLARKVDAETGGNIAMEYPVVIGNDKLAKEYNLTSMPMTLLIDREGRIALSHTGVVNKDDFESHILQLLK